MKTQSKYEFQPYEHSGREVRFHWNVESFEVEDDPDLHYRADEALCLDTDSAEVMLGKIKQEGASQEIAQELVNAWTERNL
jgi:hypothetical protein